MAILLGPNIVNPQESMVLHFTDRHASGYNEDDDVKEEYYNAQVAKYCRHALRRQPLSNQLYLILYMHAMHKYHHTPYL